MVNLHKMFAKKQSGIVHFAEVCGRAVGGGVEDRTSVRVRQETARKREGISPLSWFITIQL